MNQSSLNQSLSEIWNKKVFGNATEEEKEEHDMHKDTVMFGVAFICLSLFVGVIFREYLKKLPLPYTALVFIFGLIMGIINRNLENFHIFTHITKTDARLLMHIFFPAIIYDASFSMNPHMFLVALSQCIVLALPGFIICTSLTAVFAKYILVPFNWEWKICFIFGTIISGTAPIAIIHLLKECGMSTCLTIIIEGESLLNSGFSILLFELLLNVHKFESLIWHFIYDCGLSVLVGYLIAVATIAMLRRIELDTDIEVTLALCIAYITYFISQISLKASGVLSVLVLGICVSEYKSVASYENESESTVHQFWETLDFWSKTLIFIIVGTTIASTIRIDFFAYDISFLLCTYIAIIVIRGIMVFLLSFFLRDKGYGFNWNYGVILTWSGLRGSVGLMLALIVRDYVLEETANQLLVQVSGTVFLTLIINAPTIKLLLKLLGVTQITAKNCKSMREAVAKLREVVNITEKVIKKNKYLLGVDWMWVRHVTYIQNPYEGLKDKMSEMYPSFDADRGECPNCKEEIKITPNEEEIKGLEEESRIKVLRIFESSIWKQLDQFEILRRTFGHLTTAAEEASDKPEKYLTVDDIQKYLHISRFTKFVRNTISKILTKLNISNRMSAMELYWYNYAKDLTGCRKWCLSTFFSRRFTLIQYWVLIFNLIPIAGEITLIFLEYGPKFSKKDLGEELIVFEIINGLLAFVYIFDAALGIIGLGCWNYFANHGNKIDFLVTFGAFCQIIIGIVVVSAYRKNYSFAIVYVLVAFGLLRLVRLLRILLSGIFQNIMDEASSVIYNVYDLAIGFIVANEEIAKSATKMIQYEPSADFAQFTAENNILQMLSCVDDLEKEFSDVANAWKTHTATVYVLRDMKNVIVEMRDSYMLDESDANLLLEIMDLKIKDTLSAPRYMPIEDGIRHKIKNVLWVLNDSMLEMILSNYDITVCLTGETIQEAGKKHESISVVSSGIVQITGQNDGEKDSSLPNTDTLWYFLKRGSFCAYRFTPESIGFLGYLLKTNCVTTATCVKNAQLVSIDYDTVRELELQFGDLSFVMWKTVSFEIAQIILAEEENYEYWTDERIKIHLEDGIFPNLLGVEEFDVHPVIVDMVLIQGRVKDSQTDIMYIGPDYIPNNVRHLTLIDDPETRPRVVIILLRKENYHARTISGWIDPENINYRGLCLIHGMKKSSLSNPQELNEALMSYTPPNFVQTMGHLFNPKGINIP